MSLNEKTIMRRIMSYELLEVADPDERKRKELARLHGKPVMLEPLLNGLFYGVYQVYWQIFKRLVRGGYWLDEQLFYLTGRSSR